MSGLFSQPHVAAEAAVMYLGHMSPGHACDIVHNGWGVLKASDRAFRAES